MLRYLGAGLGTVLLASTAMAESRWDGADDLPVSPLACGAGGAADVAAKPFDGGAPTSAPDLNGKPLTVVDVPKLIGIGYFNATTKGMQEAAKELGNVTVTTDGPTKANIDEQITFIDNYITRGVNGILFAANDPVAIAPVLRRRWARASTSSATTPTRRPTRASGSSTRPSSTASARRWSTRWRPRSARTGRSPSSPRPSPRPTRRAGSPRCRPIRRNATRR